MVDNIILNPGAGGATLATDDAGVGGQVQLVKLALSADGSATTLSANNTTGLLVDVSRVVGNVTVIGAAADGAAAAGNPVLVAGFDGINAQSISTTTGGQVHVHDGGNSLTVDGAVAATQSGAWSVTDISGTVSLPTGASTAARQDTGNTSLGTLAGAVAGVEMQVDVVAALPAGNNNIGDVDVASLPALPAGANTIGTVEIGATSLAALESLTTVSTVTNLSQMAGAAIAMGTGVRSAGTQRVTVATDDVVTVTDNGGSLTVDAPVGTPVFVRLSDGASAIATLPVDSELTTADLDTGVGTDTRAVVGLVLAASGGGVLAGTANPVPVSDNGGSLTVDNGGTFAVQAAQSGTWNVTNVSGTVSLPTGAATAAKQPALGTAGVSSTDVISVQGIASGTALPVSGTVAVTGVATAANQTTGNTSLATIAGAVAGTEMQVDVLTMPTVTVQATDLDVRNLVSATDKIDVELLGGVAVPTADYDSGAGTVTRPMIGLSLPGAGGPVAGGTSTAPVRTDPTGTTTQPISAASLPLPAGASTLAEQQTQTTALQLIDDAVSTTGAAVPAKGIQATGTDGTTARALKTDAAGELQVDVLTLPNVTIGAAIPAGTNNIGGVDVLSSALPTGASTLAEQQTQTTALQLIDDTVHAANAVLGKALAIGGVMDDTATVAATEGNVSAARVTAQRAIHVNLRDNTGAEVSVGGGTQYDEDTVSTAADKVTMAGVVRKDAAATLVDADGDRTQLQVDAAGALRVTGGGGGTEYVVDAIAPATPTGATFVMERDDALSALIEVEGDWTNPRSNANGALWVKQDGTATVDGSGVTQPVSNAGLTELAAAINASSQLDVNIAASGATVPVSNAGLTALNGAIAGTEVQVDVVAALPTGANTIGAVNIAAAQTLATVTTVSTVTNLAQMSGAAIAMGTGVRSAGTQRVTVATDDVVPISGTVTASNTAGDVAHNAADSGNPVKVGGKASSTAPTAVADNARANWWMDSFGRGVVSDLDPEVGLATGVTSLRDRLVAQRYTVLADSVADGLATFWTSTLANGGTAAVSGGEGLIQTSANALGSAQLVSTTPAYYPGQVSWFNNAIRLGDTGSVGNIRRWGVFTVSGTTPQDGFAYELSGTTLNAVTFKGGVATAVASTSWTRVTPAPFTLDTNYHSFEIRWTANSVWFLIDNVVRHVASGGATTITNTLNFPMTIHTVNSSGATNRLIAVRNCGIGRFGEPEEAGSTPDVTMQSAAVATGNGTVLTITGYGTAVVNVTGTFVATITFEASADGTNYNAISATQIGGTTIATTATTTGIYRLSVAGMMTVRARISAYTSGSVTAIGRATNAPHTQKAVAISGSVAVTNAGTFATQVDGAALTSLQLADNSAVDHDAVAVAGVTQIGLAARTTDGTAVASGDVTRALATLLGKQIVKLDAVPDLTWSYAAASGGIVNTTAVTIRAAGAAGVRNYLKSIQVINGHATVSTEVLVRDGSAGTVLHRGYAYAAGGGYAATFDPPLRGTAATLMEVVNITTGSATYVNASGFTASE